MRLDTALFTRRSLLAAALASSARWSPPAFASSIDERTREAAQYVASPSGLPYFDTPIFYGNGFEDLPCGGSCLRRKWSPCCGFPYQGLDFACGGQTQRDRRLWAGLVPLHGSAAPPGREEQP